MHIESKLGQSYSCRNGSCKTDDQLQVNHVVNSLDATQTQQERENRVWLDEGVFHCFRFGSLTE